MKAERLTTSESLMLDVVRVCAAATVAFGHLTQHFFSAGWTDETVLARKAVSVFFVLSGFVIRHVTTRHPGTLGRFLGDRASRIYSVAIPALFLTWITDTIAKAANPNFFGFWVGDYRHPLGRILINLAFCGHLWTHVVTPLSNAPYWSVNYEAAYYLLYGVAFYLAGSRRVFWVLAISLLYGPRVLYLAPLWIAGCVIHDLYQRWNFEGTAEVWINGMLVVALGLAVLVDRHPQAISLGFYPHLNSMANSVGIRPPDYFFGIVWTAIFLRLLLLARRFRIESESRFAKSVRFISEGTFPIYLIHFPVYVLVAACIPYDHSNPVAKLTLFGAVVLMGIMAGHPCNKIKMWMRSLPLADGSARRLVRSNSEIG